MGKKIQLTKVQLDALNKLKKMHKHCQSLGIAFCDLGNGEYSAYNSSKITNPVERGTGPVDFYRDIELFSISITHNSYVEIPDFTCDYK